MFRTITDSNYSHAALLRGVNGALAKIEGFQATDNLDVLKGMLAHYPTIKDEVYASAGATRDPKWITAVWTLCDIDPKHIAKTILDLDDSGPILNSLLKRANDPSIAPELASLCARRNDYMSAVKILSAGAITKAQFNEGLSKLESPALFAVKVHSFGVIDDLDLFDIVRKNANPRQIAIFLGSIEPKKAILNWASQRFAESTDGLRQLFKLSIEKPEFAKWAGETFTRYESSEYAWQLYRIGQGYHPSITDLQEIRQFNDAIPLHDLEQIVINTSNVEIALKLVEMKASDPSLSAGVIQRAGLLDLAIENYPDLQEDKDLLFQKLFDLDMKSGDYAGISFANKGSERVAKIETNMGADKTKKPVIHSQLAPD